VKNIFLFYKAWRSENVLRRESEHSTSLLKFIFPWDQFQHHLCVDLPSFIPLPFLLHAALMSCFCVGSSISGWCRRRIILWIFYILIYIQQDALHSLFYLETALHVSGGSITHHQERKQLYLQHLVFVIRLLLPAAIVEELELLLSSNSSTIAAGSINGVTNTRCCRYSCMRSWWWVVVPLETCRAVSR
jgi:hypothetical protein